MELVIAAVWLAFGGFTFWSLWRDQLSTDGFVTLGGMCRILVFAALGPGGFFAALSVLPNHVAAIRRWTSTPVYRRRESRHE